MGGLRSAAPCRAAPTPAQPLPDLLRYHLLSGVESQEETDDWPEVTPGRHRAGKASLGLVKECEYLDMFRSLSPLYL